MSSPPSSRRASSARRNRVRAPGVVPCGESCSAASSSPLQWDRTPTRRPLHLAARVHAAGDLSRPAD
eukprot:12216299-Alexandrium_andersonii.AAC.1